ncbi:MAG: sulfate transporter family protein [Hyphomicrobiales bacterium]|nr:sulfate transporter family protein [Hyphomicrobiales bacterium]
MPILTSAFTALNQIFTPPFRSAFWKVLTLTLAVLAAAGFAIDRLAVHFIESAAALHYPWLVTALSVLTGVGLFIGLAFLIAPVSMLIAGFFLDDLAEKAEADLYPPGQRGRAVPVGQATWLALRFSLVALAVNFAALLVFLLPGVNALVFFVANAYLFGREYFELAALRFRPIEEVQALRRQHAATLFVAGLFIAGFVAVPLLNLVTPLFGVAFMTALHKQIAPPVALARPA